MGRSVAFKFELGDRVRSTRTGLEGTVNGLTVYANGETGVCLEYIDAQGVGRSDWFHEALAELTTPAT